MGVKQLLLLSWSLFFCSAVFGQNMPANKFRQLDQDLPTPNVYRNAAGAPGHQYWQQKADYVINLELNDKERRIYGEETITYTNNSPDALDYLWLQLDQNLFAKDSDTKKINETSMSNRSIGELAKDFDGGFKIDHVKDANGKALVYVINKTMMRVDLPSKLLPKGQYSFKIKWWYNINNTQEINGRSGYEPFKDGNNVYCIAQFFPRMCVYNEVEGWQNKQFLGSGEFALVFGDYEVNLTVPADHLVAASGELQNAKDVLDKEQQKRLEEAAKEYEHPVIIASLDEAEARSKQQSATTKTWKFKAKNVRDFAFASSRRFIWDAMAVKMESGKNVMAMSMYVKEGDCLWSKYSTEAVAHTLKWYSHYTFEYPYPVAWSIDGSMGMEYPMICFNYGRCEEDGTYAARMKYGHIGVIIHEVGHNYFPMIVNSDERQWTWMDEGLNSFLQYLTEQQWEENYPSRRGPAHKITEYMGGDKSKISPIMTNSESIFQFGNNAYGKPATALNILRETIMGRELFDYAFKTYAQRWMFKHPTPADFFRTMEDASGVDLDWFWRGWFYSIDHVDIALKEVKWYQLNTRNPEIEKPLAELEEKNQPRYITDIRNEKAIDKTEVENDPTLADFYTTNNPFEVNSLDKKEYQEFYKKLSDKEKAFLDKGYNFYEVAFENIGGLPMPLIVQLNYKDGTNELHHIPAEIWRMDATVVKKIFMTEKEIESITLDPFIETADVDTNNNYFPRKAQMSRFEMYKAKETNENPMQRANRAKKEAGKE
jgi:hypothetical protein